MNNKTYEDEIIEFEKEKNKIQNELDDYKNQLYKKFNIDDYVYLPDKIREHLDFKYQDRINHLRFKINVRRSWIEELEFIS
tara:strand:+ start:205 stop:447 length:243 start_codon:yes stop_codon:yes gene_type:complete